jgi:hypothetical protein
MRLCACCDISHSRLVHPHRPHVLIQSSQSCTTNPELITPLPFRLQYIFYELYQRIASALKWLIQELSQLVVMRTRENISSTKLKINMCEPMSGILPRGHRISSCLASTTPHQNYRTTRTSKSYLSPTCLSSSKSIKSGVHELLPWE